MLRDSYVDDLHTGGYQDDVNRMMGTWDVTSDQFTGTIPRFLGNVGLSLKYLVQSGSTDVEANAKLSGCALGYLWEPSTNLMGVKIKFNHSKKRKGLRIKPNLLMSDLDGFRNSVLSKRQVLGLCNGVYDPLGMASPYTIKLKLLIRETLLSQDRSDYSSKKSWDKPIP